MKLLGGPSVNCAIKQQQNVSVLPKRENQDVQYVGGFPRFIILNVLMGKLKIHLSCCLQEFLLRIYVYHNLHKCTLNDLHIETKGAFL